jgi:translation initiation factor IF-1
MTKMMTEVKANKAKVEKVQPANMVKVRTNNSDHSTLVVTLPVSVRKFCGIKEGDNVLVTGEDKGVISLLRLNAKESRSWQAARKGIIRK